MELLKILIGPIILTLQNYLLSVCLTCAEMINLVARRFITTSNIVSEIDIRSNDFVHVTINLIVSHKDYL